MRIRLAALALAATLAAPAAAIAGESYTTRIEPRAYYGATVTIEQGVRVWRPLPPVRHMIINPDHGTSLSLNHTDVRETRTNHNYNYNYNYSGGDRGYGYGYGGGIGFPQGERKHDRRPNVGGLGPRSQSSR